MLPSGIASFTEGVSSLEVSSSVPLRTSVTLDPTIRSGRLRPGAGWLLLSRFLNPGEPYAGTLLPSLQAAFAPRALPRLLATMPPSDSSTPIGRAFPLAGYTVPTPAPPTPWSYRRDAEVSLGQVRTPFRLHSDPNHPLPSLPLSPVYALAEQALRKDVELPRFYGGSPRQEATTSSLVFRTEDPPQALRIRGRPRHPARVSHI